MVTHMRTLTQSINYGIGLGEVYQQVQTGLHHFKQVPIPP